jgi:hypothetical protein
MLHFIIFMKTHPFLVFFDILGLSLKSNNNFFKNYPNLKSSLWGSTLLLLSYKILINKINLRTKHLIIILKRSVS